MVALVVYGNIQFMQLHNANKLKKSSPPSNNGVINEVHFILHYRHHNIANFSFDL